MRKQWLDLFQSAGIAAASIDGTMDAGTRRELLQRLAVGRPKGAHQLCAHR
jgi:hypothetical protein